jgi:DNA (cytosine-5)-methyltransferase 1
VTIPCPDLDDGPWMVDTYCCAGGATRGYQQAGFKVLGVDINPQRHYIGDAFVQADAVGFLYQHGHKFVAGHGSPPCQAWTDCQRIQGREHPMLIADTRAAFRSAGIPYVIENVMGAAAELINPVMLCGAMFPELRVYRHRLFETNFPIDIPVHPEHATPQAKMGRPPKPDEFMHVVGNFSGVAQARRAMGIDWMVRDDLREAIPPAYTRHIGEQIMMMVEGVAA